MRASGLILRLRTSWSGVATWCPLGVGAVCDSAEGVWWGVYGVVPQNPCRPVGWHGFGASVAGPLLGFGLAVLAVVYDLSGDDLFAVLLTGVLLGVVLQALNFGLEDAHGLAEAACHAGQLGCAEEQDDKEDNDDDGRGVAENLAHGGVPFC